MKATTTFAALAAVTATSTIKLTSGGNQASITFDGSGLTLPGQCSHGTAACVSVTDALSDKIDAINLRLDNLEAVDHTTARANLQSDIDGNTQDIADIELIKGSTGAKGQQGTHVQGAKGAAGTDGKNVREHNFVCTFVRWMID